MPRCTSRHARAHASFAFVWQNSKQPHCFWHGIGNHLHLSIGKPRRPQKLGKNLQRRFAPGIVRAKKIVRGRLQRTSELNKRRQIGHAAGADIVVQPLHGYATRGGNLRLRNIQGLDAVPNPLGELFNHAPRMRRKKIARYKR